MRGSQALSDATFDEHVKSADTPVLVDFWAEWCGPCKMIAPVLEEISAEHKGKIEIAKLNIDENLDVTRRYEVMSIPTLILFKDGEPAAADRRRPGQGPAPPGAAGVPVEPGVGPAPRLGRQRSEAVADLQRRLALRRVCRTAPDADGLFGAGTEAAVEALPAPAGPARRRGVRPPDLGGPGRGGLAPRGPLPLPAAGPCSGATTSPTCSSACRALGFDTGRVDGIFGDAHVAGSGRLPAQRRPARRRHPGRVDVPRAPTGRAPPRRPRAGEHGPRPGPAPPGPAHPARPAHGHRRGGRPRRPGGGRPPPPGGHRCPGHPSPPPRRFAPGRGGQRRRGRGRTSGLRLDPDRTGCSTAYYSGYRYESAGGRRLAELIHALAAAALGVPADGVQGHDPARPARDPHARRDLRGRTAGHRGARTPAPWPRPSSGRSPPGRPPPWTDARVDRRAGHCVRHGHAQIEVP